MDMYVLICDLDISKEQLHFYPSALSRLEGYCHFPRFQSVCLSGQAAVFVVLQAIIL